MRPRPLSCAPRQPDPYLSAVRRHRVLTADDERALARAYRASGDTRAAHTLVTANLRFVLKVAREYRRYGVRQSDLIQEGNLGLVRAVERFDPERGVRLISYAVWWIRAYMQNHILSSWSLVRFGTTQEQRKLFFSAHDRRAPAPAPLAARPEAGDGESPVDPPVQAPRTAEARQRIRGGDLSLDAPAGEGEGATHGDLLPSDDPSQHQQLDRAERERRVRRTVRAALALLDRRERFVVERRLMSEEPMTLLEVGQHFGVSRERARQVEVRAREKLRKQLWELALELDGV